MVLFSDIPSCCVVEDRVMAFLSSPVVVVVAGVGGVCGGCCAADDVIVISSLAGIRWFVGGESFFSIT